MYIFVHSTSYILSSTLLRFLLCLLLLLMLLDMFLCSLFYHKDKFLTRSVLSLSFVIPVLVHHVGRFSKSQLSWVLWTFKIEANLVIGFCWTWPAFLWHDLRRWWTIQQCNNSKRLSHWWCGGHLWCSVSWFWVWLFLEVLCMRLVFCRLVTFFLLLVWVSFTHLPSFLPLFNLLLRSSCAPLLACLPLFIPSLMCHSSLSCFGQTER